jgi:hypothetical protein
MTSFITKEQYERVMESIKKEFPNWDGKISSAPLIVNGFLDIDKEGLDRMIKKEIEKCTPPTFQEQIAKFLYAHPRTWTELTMDDCMIIAEDLLAKFFTFTMVE